MSEYEDYGGVVANWINFGTSGLLKRKDNSQIFNFIYTDSSECSTIKSIVQPKKVEIQGIHSATFLDNHFAVSSDYIPLHNNCYSSPFINDKIQINHYFFRTYEDYEHKIARRKHIKIWNSQTLFEDEQKKYTQPSIEFIKFYTQLKNTVISDGYSGGGYPSSVSDFTQQLISIISKDITKNQIIIAELLCCDACLIFDNEPMIYYFRAVISRLTNDLHKALRFIYIALKLSGSSTIYYEYSRILEQLGENEKSKLVKKHGDYKKHIEDTTCEPIIE